VKRCFKCLVEKPLSEFYRHHMMADGHLSKCKECARADVGRHRRAHLEEVREYDRRRASEPHRIDLCKQITERFAQEFPERLAAQRAANNALRDGKIGRADVCEGCGSSECPVEKHHLDYARPLLVMWLCKPCHAIADKIRRRLETAIERIG